MFNAVENAEKSERVFFSTQAALQASFQRFSSENNERMPSYKSSFDQELGEIIEHYQNIFGVLKCSTNPGNH